MLMSIENNMVVMHENVAAAFLVLIFTLFVIVIVLVLTPTPTQPPPTPTQPLSDQAQPVDESGRVFSSLSSLELIESVLNLTNIQAQPIIDGHVGRWLTVTEEVHNVTERERFMSVYAQIERGAQRVPGRLYMSFAKDEWRDQVRMLRRGDSIKVNGRIQSIGAYNLDLEECELVN